MLSSNKIIIIVLLVLSQYHETFSQIMGQDQDGFSSIILPSSNINIDLNNNISSVSLIKVNKLYSNKVIEDTISCLTRYKEKSEIIKCLQRDLKSSDEEENKKNGALVYGLDIMGKSKNGISYFIKNNSPTNNVSLNAIFGYLWDNRKFNTRENFLDQFVTVKDSINLIYKEIRTLDTIITNKISELKHKKVINNNMSSSFSKFSILTSDNYKIRDKIRTLEKQISNFNNSKDSVSLYKYMIKEIDREILKIERIVKIFDETKPYYSYKTDNVDTFVVLNKNASEILTILTQLNNESQYKIVKYDIELTDFLDSSKWSTAHKNILLKKKYLESEKKLLASIIDNKPNYKKILTPLLETYLDLVKRFEKFSNDLEKLNNRKVHFNKSFLYLKGGLKGTSFKYDLENNDPIISNRFEDRSFLGNQLQIGYTRQFKTNHFLGFNVMTEYADNSSLLTSSTFKYLTVDTTTSPKLEVSTEIEALKGKYEKFQHYQFSMDYVWLISLTNRSKDSPQEYDPTIYLSFNPYLRHNIYSGTESLSPKTVLGLGLYAYNPNDKSFAGGLFIQCNDIFLSKKEIANDGKLIFNFGIVVKYNLKSFNPSDK